MSHRLFAGILLAALLAAASGHAQMKDAPKSTRTAAIRTIDINSASEMDLTGLGLDKTLAKKIVEGRPYRNKRDLLSRQLLTPEQYEKVKDHIVARQGQ